jgi:hypothetical protein
MRSIPISDARRRALLELLESPGAFDLVPDGSRRCSRCGEVKAIDEFPMKYKDRGLRRVWCRDCCREYGREHYRKNRQAYLDKAVRRNRRERSKARDLLHAYLRQHPCVDCGESDITLLDFDHRDRSMKRATISRLIHTEGWDGALVEIEKCDVRCANCHRRRTARQFNWRRDPARGALDATQIASIGPVLTRPSFSGRPVVEQMSIWLIGVTKRCSGCGLEKPLHGFAFRDRKKGTRQSSCRACHATARRQHYERNRSNYIMRALAQMRQREEHHTRLLHEYLKTHSCVDCGEVDIRVLEFDHLDPIEKVAEISYMLGRRSWTVIFEEIGKCDVVCVNCHRRRTATRQSWIKRLGESRGRYNYNHCRRGSSSVGRASGSQPEGSRVRDPSPAQ